MMKPFASCRRDIFAESPRRYTSSSSTDVGRLTPHHEQLRHVRETRAAVRQSADAPASAYGCRREETWNVPLSESVLALSRLQQEGKIRLIGLSNITIKQLEEARSIAQIASVQNRYSVAERQGDPMVGFLRSRRSCIRAVWPFGEPTR
jgi:aryl-alcohol dehydrogenase-like predicted oxidoreductase